MQIGKKIRSYAADGSFRPRLLLLIGVLLLVCLIISSLAAKAATISQGCSQWLDKGEQQDRNCIVFRTKIRASHNGTPQRWIEVYLNHRWQESEQVDCGHSVLDPNEHRRYYEAHSIVARYWCPEAIDSKGQIAKVAVSQ